MDVLSASALDSEINWYENLTNTSVETISNEIPTEFSLNQNYPNPFNPSTTIFYALPQSEAVVLKVHNILGQEVAALINEVKQTGNHKVVFDASALPSGLYIYNIQAGSYTSTKKMLLLK